MCPTLLRTAVIKYKLLMSHVCFHRIHRSTLLTSLPSSPPLPPLRRTLFINGSQMDTELSRLLKAIYLSRLSVHCFLWKQPRKYSVLISFGWGICEGRKNHRSLFCCTNMVHKADIWFGFWKILNEALTSDKPLQVCSRTWHNNTLNDFLWTKV